MSVAEVCLKIRQRVFVMYARFYILLFC